MRVLIVDDHKLFAEAIRSALGRNGMDMLPVATNAAEGVDAARSGKPDLVLLDLGLPDAHGIATGKEILRACPGTKVVAVTALSDPGLLKEAMKAGFHGYVTKDTEIRRFVDSITAVMNGKAVVPRRLAGAVTEGRRSQDRSADLLAEQLTRRERSILALLVEGASSEEMARRLGISPNTVRTHVQNVLTKLQVHSRLEAATFAVRHGLVTKRQKGRR